MILTDMYVHGSKESNWEQGKELGLSDDACMKFAYACYEVTIAVEIDPETGVAMATHLNNVRLEKPVEV